MFEELDHYQTLADTLVVIVNLVVVLSIAGAVGYFLYQRFGRKHDKDSG